MIKIPLVNLDNYYPLNITYNNYDKFSKSTIRLLNDIGISAKNYFISNSKYFFTDTDGKIVAYYDKEDMKLYY